MSTRAPAGALLAGLGPLALAGAYVAFFGHAGLRKLYAEIPAFNAPQFAGALDYMQVEAILREHAYYAGRYWDVVVVGMDAADWQSLRG